MALRHRTCELGCAAGSGVNVIVARGAEGGGHGSPAFALLPLLDGVRDAFDVPVLSSAGDAALGYPWPHRFPDRVLRTAFTDHWVGREDELWADPVAQAEFFPRSNARTTRCRSMPDRGGGAVNTMQQSAAEVIATLTEVVEAR